ncbi:MAG: hypothetical protein WC047_08900 [Kiritimatiellales bacterium]
MAAKVLRPISIYVQQGKEGVTIENAVGEDASESWKAGAPISRETGSTGSIVEWPGGTDATLPIGIAAKDATGVTGAAVPHYEANDYNLFEMSMVADTGTATLAAANLGTAYSLIKVSSGNWYVDQSDVTTKLVEVVGFIDAVGDTNPRVICRFIGDHQGNVLQS